MGKLNSIVEKGLKKVDEETKILDAEHKKNLEAARDPTFLLKNSQSMTETAKKLEAYNQHEKILARRVEKIFSSVFTANYVSHEWKGETANEYNYSKNVVGQIGKAIKARFVIFANNDAHIALGESTEHNCKKYEVVIGGWGNTASVIRHRN